MALRLSTGSGVRVSDLLATGFPDGGVVAYGRSGQLFAAGEESVTDVVLYSNGFPQLRGPLEDLVESIGKVPKLLDVRDFPNPDPRLKPDSPALPVEGAGYIGAFGRTENWLQEWTVFGPESAYDLRERGDEGN